MSLAITFSPEMIKANAEGRKSQTRYILMPQPDPEMKLISPPQRGADGRLFVQFSDADGQLKEMRLPCAPGDTLWIRENYYQYGHWEPVHGQPSKTVRQKWAFVADRPEVLFERPANYRLRRDDLDPCTPAWHMRLARYMPRAFSRQTITVTDVQVQKLHDITDADAMAEGIQEIAEGIQKVRSWPWTRYHFAVRTDKEPWDWPCGHSPREAYAALWRRLYGRDSWKVNYWVVVIHYRPDVLNVRAAEAKSEPISAANLPQFLLAEPYNHRDAWR